jgi:hypothetical protein
VRATCATTRRGRWTPESGRYTPATDEWIEANLYRGLRLTRPAAARDMRAGLAGPAGAVEPVEQPHANIQWVVLRRLWTRWSEVLVFVKPETVVRWHRAGFRLYWNWRSRRRLRGRPCAATEIRTLIRRLATENPTWGAPCMHGELRMLGLDDMPRTATKWPALARLATAMKARPSFKEVYAREGLTDWT